MEQVEEICDQIVLVNKGKKILDGTVKSVKQDFKENLFRIGFNEMPDAADSHSFDVVKPSGKDALVVKLSEGATPNDVLNYYLQSGASIVSFNEILPSLNEIFIQLVEGTPATRQFQNVTA
jgi:ABC-2 type transport system ATP-binding protein